MRWNQRARPRYAHVRAEPGEKVSVRARHATVCYVADDCDLQTREPALVLSNCECIEERLSRMLVCAVASVDDRGVDHLRELMRNAGRWMPDDDRVRGHRFEVPRGVDQGF